MTFKCAVKIFSFHNTDRTGTKTVYYALTLPPFFNIRINRKILFYIHVTLSIGYTSCYANIRVPQRKDSTLYVPLLNLNKYITLNRAGPINVGFNFKNVPWSVMYGLLSETRDIIRAVATRSLARLRPALSSWLWDLRQYALFLLLCLLPENYSATSTV